MTIPVTELATLAARNGEAFDCLLCRGVMQGRGLLEVSEADYAECLRARGLGDLVAKVAKPIARAIDAVAGTDLANCGGCAERQRVLNELLPL